MSARIALDPIRERLTLDQAKSYTSAQKTLQSQPVRRRDLAPLRQLPIEAVDTLFGLSAKKIGR